MRVILSKKIISLFVLLVTMQPATVQIFAESEYITIAPLEVKCKWGIVKIPEQPVELRDQGQSPTVSFTVENIPQGFKLKNLIIDGRSEDYISYSNYLKMYSQSVPVEVRATPLPIKQPSDLVDVINAFVPDGAKLGNSGEVLLQKNIYYNGIEDESWTGYEPWIFQADVTIIGSNGTWGVNEAKSIEGFDFILENSNIITNEGIFFCDLDMTNSSIGFSGGDTKLGTVKTHGQVTFKGVNLDGSEFDKTCPPDIHAAFSFEEIENSTVVFENLNVTFNNQLDITQTGFINTNNAFLYFLEERPRIVGGNWVIDHSILRTNNSSSITIEGGNFQLDHTSSWDGIMLNGSDANLKIKSGEYTGLIVNNGKVEIDNGYFPNGLTMNGGELIVNNGTITSLNVNKEDCKIELNNGRFKSVNMPIEVKKPILSLLGPNASYYDRDGTYMPFKLVDIKGVEQKEGAIVTGMAYPVSFVISKYGSTPSAAYEAALKADVGVNGKDIRMRENGDIEIWTPEGMAWLAFVQSDTHDRVLTGREYFEKSKDWYLMADIDMDGYGTGWPNLNVSGRTFYGQQHRIYNMNILRPDASFFNEINYNGVVRDLIVEGSATNQEDEGGRDIVVNMDFLGYNVAGFVRNNIGLIVNCAFKGGVWNSAICALGRIGGFASQNTGRIENCYMAPCEQMVGGARNASDAPLINKRPCDDEHYSVGGFVCFNTYSSVTFEDGSMEYVDGYVKNCYFGGTVTYNVPSPSEGVFITDIGQGICENKSDSCETLYYLDADISAETLNKNVLAHTEETYDDGWGLFPYVEWAAWTECDDKQCGRPYFVWEKNLDDTPSGIDGVEAQGGFKAWCEGGMLCFSTNGAADVLVYSAGGRLCVRHSAQTGTERVALPKGIYIVKCEGISKKVIL